MRNRDDGISHYCADFDPYIKKSPKKTKSVHRERDNVKVVQH